MRQQQYFHTGKEVVFAAGSRSKPLQGLLSKNLRLETQVLHSILDGHLLPDVINGL